MAARKDWQHRLSYLLVAWMTIQRFEEERWFEFWDSSPKAYRVGEHIRFPYLVSP